LWTPVGASELGDLKREAETLENELALARAFATNDIAQWRQLPRQAVQRLVLGLIKWTSRESNNVMVAPPSRICQNSYFIMPSHRVNLNDLALWVMAGLVTQEELRAAG